VLIQWRVDRCESCSNRQHDHSSRPTRTSQIPDTGRTGCLPKGRGRCRPPPGADVSAPRCATLAHTGCRISEALALTADRIDLKDGTIVIASAKKRKTGIYRPIPVPAALLDMLNLVHDIRGAQKRRDGGSSVRLWDWSRTKGWYVVCAVMKAAKITGPHATPKGLRRRLRHQGDQL
jgi:integrase